jgi:6-phosphogluconolactonase
MRLSLLLLLLVVGGFAHAHPRLALIGTYTGGESRGIYVVRLDDETGALSQPLLAAGLSNPEFLALHPNGRFVYALTRVKMPDGRNGGAVAAFAIDARSGKLALLNVEATGRASLTHLAVDATGRMVVAASYGGGYVVSFPILAEGRIGGPGSVLTQEGELGPNRARQEASHPHSVTLSPDNRYAFVADLGYDRVFSYRLDPEHGTLAHNDPAFATFAPGAGPRHSKFSADGRFFYLLNELDSTLTACRYDAARGVVTPFQRSSTLPDDFTGKNGTSEVRIHPSGRFVYAANRGHDSLAVFARDTASGALTRVEIVPCGGQHPRNFALTPDGAWLLCGHQNSDSLAVFRVDAQTGRLTQVGAPVAVPKPVCVLFLR